MPEIGLKRHQSTSSLAEQTHGMDEQAKRCWLNDMAEKKLMLAPPDEKKKQPDYIRSMTSADPTTANTLLENYIKTINDKVITQDDRELRNALAAMIQSRQKEQQDIEFSIKAERNNHLAALSRP